MRFQCNGPQRMGSLMLLVIMNRSSMMPMMIHGFSMSHNTKSSTTTITTTTTTTPSQTRQHADSAFQHIIRMSTNDDNNNNNNNKLQIDSQRRKMMLSSAALTFALLQSTINPANARVDDDCGLDTLLLGQGKWTNVKDVQTISMQSDQLPLQNAVVPATFATYAARFLLNFDDGAKSWWDDTVRSYSLLPEDQRQAKLGNVFGRLARSVQIALHRFIQDYEKQPVLAYEELANQLSLKYGSNKQANRHIALLFATLPKPLQPTRALSRLSVITTNNGEPTESELALDLPAEVLNPPPRILIEQFDSLLPEQFRCVRVKNSNTYTIYPPITLFEIGVDEEFGKTATITAAGPLAELPLRRELPNFSFDIYTLFGISGAAGCALTHTLVIPLDVVKTKIQTDGGEGDLIQSAISIVETDGISGLLLGAQATIAGYVWYGLSVYPCYAFFKRFLAQSVLTPELATIHANDVALVAGALAAVVASLGLTPLEASRIRAVADPETYRPKGMIGTLQVLATEDEKLGWKALYSGLPSLMTRQVIFGSVKFLAFEKACEAIFRLAPSLHDAVWTSLAVSLVAGGFSGALSSVVSQPADSVLTYVAQSSKGNLGVIEGSLMMIEEGGIYSLFRGLGSRCVWAGTIIAGQFLLYDVFRNYFGVSGDDLSQIYEVIISSQGASA